MCIPGPAYNPVNHGCPTNTLHFQSSCHHGEPSAQLKNHPTEMNYWKHVAT